MIDPRRSVARRRITRAIARLQRGPKPVGEATGLAFRCAHWARLRFFEHLNGWRHRREQPPIDPREILEIDPSTIDRCVLGIVFVPGATWRNVGLVRDGDWDLRTRPFDGLRTVRALEDRFLRGVPWEETEYYRRSVGKMRAGHVRWDCLTEAEFARRCERLDRLHDSIRRNGYLRQAELPTPATSDPATGLRRHFDRQRRLDEVVVCVGRSGELLFADGQHRLALARMLGVERIPVRVLIRHERWQDLRRRLYRAIQAEPGGRIRHALPHPDLRFSKPLWDSTAWAELVTTRLDPGSRSVLEVDAGLSGFFSARLAGGGWECTALEPHPIRRSLLERVREACTRPFAIVGEDELPRVAQGGVDAVLILDPATLRGAGGVERLLRLAALASREVLVAVEPVAGPSSTPSRMGPESSHPERLVELLVDRGICHQVDTLPGPGGSGVLLHGLRTRRRGLPKSDSRGAGTTTLSRRDGG